MSRDCAPVQRSVRRIALIALVGAATALSSAQAQSREPYPGFDAYVNAALATWKVPGIGIAIVRNDSVVYAKGYGVREAGKPDRVDEHTIFAIGSSSKAFTAAAIGMLVNEKKVNWDTPVATYLPGFQLYDAYASKELTVRDLLSHRSGLARGELLWYGSGNDRAEVVRRVRFLQPSWSFRSQFGYQNIMFLAAGQIVDRVAHVTWDDFIRDRIFTPLGMRSTTSSTHALAGQSNVASPHAEINDTLRVVAWRNIDNAGPAGSINSNVVDMSQWVRLQLGGGVYGGQRLLSQRSINEMHTPQTIIRIDTAAKRLNPDTHFQSYGFGWFLQDYRGREVWQHGGNVNGFTALVGMMPEEKLGVVLLTNMNGTGLPTALMNKIFDLHLKAPARDWSADMRKRTEEQRARGREAQKKLEGQRVAGTKPSLPLSAYAGVFADSLYGDMTVRENGGQLTLSFGPNFQGTLEHWHFDTFRTRFDTPVLPAMFVQFHVSPSAKVDELLVEMTGAPTIFRRRPVSGERLSGTR